MILAEMEFGSNMIMVLAFLAIAAVFYLVEICTPTFGIMAAAAGASDIAAIYFAYQINTFVGTNVMIATLVGTVAYLYLLVKYLPSTPLGRLLVNRDSRDATNEATPEADQLEALVGCTGRALSDLRPVGKVLVCDRTIDARAERGMIEKDETIEVIAAGGTDLVVRRAKSRDMDKQQADAAETSQEE